MNYLIEELSQLRELEPIFRQLKEDSSPDSPSIVAVDTEFFREKTYSAQLCLIQLGIAEHQYCIDVLAIEDLSLLVDLFENDNVIKLFHAARQDMEVIYQTLGILPKPIFDTQLASAFLGSDMQIGYGALVSERLGVELPKTQSRTNWTRRPLSPEQIEYAGDDVAYLEVIYRQVIEELKTADKLDWYESELETYYQLDKYIIDPTQAYKRLSGGALRIKHQYILKALAEWREATAIKKNIPRSWVLRDDKLYELACSNAKNEEAVKKLGVFGRKAVVYMAPQALKVMQNAETGDDKLWRSVEPLNKQEKSLCTLMMKDLTKIAGAQKIAQALLATRKDVENLYRYRQSKKLLNGWREGVVGEPLLVFLREQQAENSEIS